MIDRINKALSKAIWKFAATFPDKTALRRNRERFSFLEYLCDNRGRT
jgi:hypothetical protein